MTSRPPDAAGEASPRRVIVGVTGASGAAYGWRLVEQLVGAGCAVHLVVSPAGRRVMADELTGAGADPAKWAGQPGQLIVHDHHDIGAPIASGSLSTAGMAICPCSTNTLAAVAAGLSRNLLERAAAVTLKERRRLVLVVRETPLSTIDLRNALQLSEAGAVICPASPGFYQRPAQVAELVEFVVAKVLNLLDVPQSLLPPWSGRPVPRGDEQP